MAHLMQKLFFAHISSEEGDASLSVLWCAPITQRRLATQFLVQNSLSETIHKDAFSSYGLLDKKCKNHITKSTTMW